MKFNKTFDQNSSIKLTILSEVYDKINYYPFKLLIFSTEIEPKFLKKTTKIARPIAASEAATVSVNMAKICPDKSLEKLENAIKFILTARRINSIDISIIITFFLFKNIPRMPIVNNIAPRKRKCSRETLNIDAFS